MARWADFQAQVPAMAEAGHRALFKTGAGEGFLVTVSADEPPRIHPVNIGIVDGRLLVFVQARSGKTKDLLSDGRYALHAMQDPTEPHEFLVRGRAQQVTDDTLRAAAVAVWPFNPGDDYPLFELDVAHALYGERGSPDDWPPQYTSWKDRATIRAN